MRALAFAVLAAGLSICEATALEDRHDEKLERAAASIVAARMGELRGSLDIAHRLTAAEEAAAVRRPAAHPASPPAGIWQPDGLAVAVERKPLASPDL